MEIKLEQDAGVFLSLADASFRKAWMALYDQCPWATCAQHVEFVDAWYGLYREKFMPVLVSARQANGELIGLLTLAADRSGKTLVGAGSVQAEYQVWLARPETSDRFIAEAMQKLRVAFPGHAIQLRYIPSNSPLDGLRPEGKLPRMWTLEGNARPYMKLDPAEIAQSLGRKTNKNLMNRMKRQGPVVFEKVTDGGALEKTLDEFVRQCDFRQAAMYGVPPFRADARKREFYAQLARRGLLHVTVLKIGSDIASLNLAQIDKNSVQIGIAHSPFYAPHSPGKFHIYLLGLELTKEGIEHFDLTPGGGYKERFATDSDTVHELVVHPSLFAYWRAQLAKRAKLAAIRALASRGISPTEARMVVGRWRKLLRPNLSSLRRLRQKEQFSLYQCRLPGGVRAASALSVARNSIDDLLAYDDSASTDTYQGFLYEAMRRLETGQQVYTVANNGCLMYAAWVVESHDPKAHAEKWNAALIEEKAAVVHEVYIHPQADSGPAYDAFLNHILHDLAKRRGVPQVHVLVQEDDVLTRNRVEQIGYAGSVIHAPAGTSA